MMEGQAEAEESTGGVNINEAIDLYLDELDDAEFELPTVSTPPTLESILNEPDNGSLSDEDLSSQLTGDGSFTQTQLWNADSADTTSITSRESQNSSRTRSSTRRHHGSPQKYQSHGVVMKHVILRGVTSQMVSAAERVDAGKPSVMAVSSMIAVGTSRGLVLIFDVKQVMKWCLGDVECSKQHGSVSSVCFNDDCSRLLVGHAKGLITKWDLSNGKLLQTIADVHPLGTAVLHIHFIDAHTEAIFSDSGGSVFQLSFKKNLSGRSCDSQCLFSGSRGEVCTIQPLVTNPYHDHPLKQHDLVAMGTMSKVIVIALKPSVQVLFSHPLKSDPSTLPILCWQYVIIQMTNTNRVVDPVLTFGRDKTIYFFQAAEVQAKTISFIPLQKIKLSFTVLNFCWLNSRTVAIFDTSEMLHIIDIRSEESLEVIDLSNIRMVYNSSHFKALSTGGNVSKAMALVGERACFQSVKCFSGQLLILGTRSLHVLTIRSWIERISYLVNRNKYQEAIALAFSFHQEKAKAVVGLTGKREDRRINISKKIEELILEFIDASMSKLKPNDVSDVQLEEYYRNCIPVCVEYCFRLDKIDLLFDTIYETVSREAASKSVFLECLEPFILNDQLSTVTPVIMQDFVDHYSKKQLFHPLESCIVHLDISSLDIHQVVTLCWKRGMYDAILYIHNGMRDYTGPLEELLVVLNRAVKTGKQLSDDHITLGNRLLVYISCCLAGRGYPRGEIPSDIVCSVRADVLGLVTAISVRNQEIGDEIYPYLKTLLKFDTREFLNVLAMAFEDSATFTESNNERQKMVDILLQVMVNSPDFMPSQVGALFTFLARQLAKPDNKIDVNCMLFEQVLEYLTNAGDDSRIEERQQALMDLLQAGGLATVDDQKLIALAEKARFYRVCEVLYEKQRRYDKILFCYLHDPVRKPQVFYYIKQILNSTKYSTYEKTLIQNEAVSSIHELVAIDNSKTAKLVIASFPQRLADIISLLQEQPEVQFRFLRGVFEYREENFKPNVQLGKENDKDAQHVVDAPVHEKYIELMCRYMLSDVAQHVKNNEGYRLEETIEICRKHKIMEAVSFLLEKAGDIKGAFAIMLESVDDKVKLVCDLIERAGTVINIEDSVEWGSLQTVLLVVIQFCQRNCPLLKEIEREALWFPLFEALTIPRRKFKDTSSSYLSAFKELTRYLLNSMMGYIAVPAILERIMKDPAYSGGKIGEIRDMIMGMLETYRYEQTLLHITNNLLCADLHSRLSNLRSIANKGYTPRTNKCNLCLKDFTNVTQQVVIFRCGHSYHMSCLQESQPQHKVLYGQESYYCGLCTKSLKKKNANQRSPDESSRTSRRVSAYLEAANQQPITKTSPSKSKVSLDQRQIQALDYIKKLHRTNSRLSVLSELSRSDSEPTQTVSPSSNSSIFRRDDFKLRLAPSCVTVDSKTIDEEC